MPSTDPWQEICSELKQSINLRSYETWIRPSRFRAIEDGNLLVEVPTVEFADWIQDRCGNKIRELILARNNGLRQICYRVPEQPPATAAASLSQEPTPEPNEELASSDCPELSEDAWYGDARTYRELVGPTCEASDNFHLACFLSIAGAGLGKSVSFNVSTRAIYPNPYVVLVGESAWAGKGMAMGLAMDLMREAIPEAIVVTSIDSAEGLYQAIYQSIQQSESKRHASVLIQLDEYNSMLAKASIKGSKIIPDLKRAFDSPPMLQINTRYSPLNLQNPPMIQLFAASETQDLSDMKPRDISGGLGNRQWFVPGDPKRGNPDAPAPDTARWKEFSCRLKETFEFWHDQRHTSLPWSPRAHERWHKFYDGLRHRGKDDRVVAKLSARDRVHAPKVALIYAALDRSPAIDIQHLDAAILFCDFLLKARYHVFRTVGLKPWVKDEIEIIDYLRRCQGSVRYRQLQQRFRRIGAETFERLMRPLLADIYHPDRKLRIEQRVGESGRKVNWVAFNS